MNIYNTIINIISVEVERIKVRSDEDCVLLDDIKKLDTLLKVYMASQEQLHKAKKPILEDKSAAEIKDLLDKAMKDLDE